jgi:radical SAM protein with 4Fe4S-binding SPASM domain
MNIMFTTSCNQNCPYCFSVETRNGKGHERSAVEIGREDLQFVLNFITRSQGSVIRIIGGEPTLHSKFRQRYEQIEKAGLSVGMFSNCVMDEDIAVFLSKKTSLRSIILNIREPREYSVQDWDRIRRTLKHIKNIILSFRIYHLDFDLQFLFDLINEFKLMPWVNIAPALPCLDGKNAYLPLRQYKAMGRRLAQWSRQSQELGIMWYTDAGFIKCGFRKQDLRELRENVQFIPENNCSAAVEVRPDLYVQRCFGLWSKANEKPIHLKQFSTTQQVHQYFNDRSQKIKQHYGALGRCATCRYLRNASCGGGCMVHILRKHPRLCKTSIYA